MLVCIDIGNSRTNIGYYTDSGLIVQGIDTHPLLDEADYCAAISEFISKNRVEIKYAGCIISSVVLTHTAVFINAVRKVLGKWAGPLVVSREMNTGLSFDRLLSPDELGADRIATAAAAHHLFEGHVAVVDFGTATTVTVIDGGGGIIGGAIMPGIGLMNESLERGTSKLRKAPLSCPSSALGRDTAQCICSGIFFGTAGAVERIVSEIEEETGQAVRMVITGGGSGMMKNYIKRKYDIKSDLIFEGLKILYDKNRA